ncbi:MAG TPA: tetratricopeptide repeat protein, partial [Candidatus Methylomirabilis sp.]|nr:tetratricopeptide repeat protein [Candidatus Methylomirabilis sp.]
IYGTHCLLSDLYLTQGDQTRAIGEGQRAVALSPGNADPLVDFALTLSDAGRSEDAISVFQQAMRLTPVGPISLYRKYGQALRRTGRFEEAVSAYQKAIQMLPESPTGHLGLATTYGLMGRAWEAREEAAQVLRINPTFSLAKVRGFQNQAEREKVVGVLRQAGLK